MAAAASVASAAAEDAPLDEPDDLAVASAVSGVATSSLAEDAVDSVATVSLDAIDTGDAIASAASSDAAPDQPTRRHGRVRVRKGAARRARIIAADWLRRAERRLRSDELEADRL